MSNVKPIPDGYHSVTPYLIVSGAAKALDFYAQALGAERTYLTHLTHETGHAELAGRLPPGILPAYDGLVVEV